MVELDKGAVTRMNNTITRAKGDRVAQAPGGNVAGQALRKKLSPKPVAKAGPPVTDVSNSGVLTPQPVNIPTGGPPSLPDEPQFDPNKFKEDVVANLLGTIRSHQFLDSAAAQDAKTSVELKEMFNQFNPNKIPDPRSMVDRVVNRMGIYPNEER